MKVGLAVLFTLAVVCLVESKGGLQIGVKKRPETCEMRSKKGDRLSMHYTVRVLVEDTSIVLYSTVQYSVLM